MKINSYLLLSEISSIVFTSFYTLLFGTNVPWHKTCHKNNKKSYTDLAEFNCAVKILFAPKWKKRLQNISHYSLDLICIEILQIKHGIPGISQF